MGRATISHRCRAASHDWQAAAPASHSQLLPPYAAAVKEATASVRADSMSIPAVLSRSLAAACSCDGRSSPVPGSGYIPLTQPGFRCAAHLRQRPHPEQQLARVLSSCGTAGGTSLTLGGRTSSPVRSQKGGELPCNVTYASTARLYTFLTYRRLA